MGVQDRVMDVVKEDMENVRVTLEKDEVSEVKTHDPLGLSLTLDSNQL